jgi:hypothetical protein
VTSSGHSDTESLNSRWATGYRLPVSLSADSAQTKIVPKEIEGPNCKARPFHRRDALFGNQGDRGRSAEIPGKTSIYFCGDRE